MLYYDVVVCGLCVVAMITLAGIFGAFVAKTGRRRVLGVIPGIFVFALCMMVAWGLEGTLRARRLVAALERKDELLAYHIILSDALAREDPWVVDHLVKLERVKQITAIRTILAYGRESHTEVKMRALRIAEDKGLFELLPDVEALVGLDCPERLQESARVTSNVLRSKQR
jgi:hypothetical protein